MNDRFTFADLRRLLLDLGFQEGSYTVEQPLPAHNVVFRHPTHDVLLVFPKQRPREPVDRMTLAAVRKQLLENGLMDQEDLENLLRRASA